MEMAYSWVKALAQDDVLLVASMLLSDEFEVGLGESCVSFRNADGAKHSVSMRMLHAKGIRLDHIVAERERLPKGLRLDQIIAARGNLPPPRGINVDDIMDRAREEVVCFDCLIEDGPAEGRRVTTQGFRPKSTIEISSLVDEDNDFTRYVKSPFKARIFKTLTYRLVGVNPKNPSQYLYRYDEEVERQPSVPQENLIETTVPEPLSPAELILRAFVAKG